MVGVVAVVGSGLMVCVCVYVAMLMGLCVWFCVGVSTGRSRSSLAQPGTNPLTSGGTLNDPPPTAGNLGSSRIGLRCTTVGSVEVGSSFNLQIFAESSSEIAKFSPDLAESSLDLRRIC